MTRKTAMLLALLVLGATAGVVTSAAQAAGNDPATPVVSARTAFDPFTLTTYVIKNSAARTSLETAVQVAAHRPIRIPFRPQLRSPFRPSWGPQAR
jgi:hypothetical protein